MGRNKLKTNFGPVGWQSSEAECFSRDENPTKHERLYEQWIFEVRSLQQTNSEAQIKKAIL